MTLRFYYLKLIILSVIILSSTQIQQLPANGLSTSAFGFSDIWQCSDPNSEIYQRNGVPSIDNPIFQSVEAADEFLDDEDLLIGLQVDGEMRAYPYKILQFHEIVNDDRSDTLTGVTYCPITGSSLVFDLGQLGGSSIGITGILFESNQVFYDHNTDSCFSQMLAFGVSGDRSAQRLDLEYAQEMPWKSWKTLYPDSAVLSPEVDNYDPSRYAVNSYAEYETSEALLFPVNFLDSEPYNLYHVKEKTIVLRSENNTVLFPHIELEKRPIVNFTIGDTHLLLVYDFFNNVTAVFDYSSYYSENLTFDFYENYTQIDISDGYGMFAITDSNNNIYNIKGELLTSSLTSVSLTPYPYYTAYWYAAIVFFPDAIIFTQDSPLQYDIEPYSPNIFNRQQEATQKIINVVIFGSIGLLVTIVVLWKKGRIPWL